MEIVLLKKKQSRTKHTASTHIYAHSQSCSEVVINIQNEGFQVLMAASINFRVFWVVVPRSHEVYRHFAGVYCLHHQGDE
jgi:hypothetical protein